MMSLRAPVLLLLLIACHDPDKPDNQGAVDTATPELEGDDAGECSDGADNDLDNLYDCADPDCAASPDCQGDTAQNYPPGQPLVAISPEAPTQDDDLLCQVTVQAVDPDGDEVSYLYDWLVDGVDSGITSATVAARFTRGAEVWTCQATATDGALQGSAASAMVTITRTNVPPTAPVVTIEPDPPGANDDLTCTLVTASQDEDGDPVTYRYDWARDGVDVNYTLPTVRTAATTMGEEWTCTVTPFDGYEEGEPGSASVTLPSCEGAAMEFDGDADWLSVSASGDFDWRDAMSAEAWVYWDGDNGQDTHTIVHHGDDPDQAFVLAVAGTTTSAHPHCSAVDAGTVLFMVASGDGSSLTCLKSASTITAGTWTHLAATYDAGNMYLFIDGTQDVWGRSGSSINDATSQPLYLGGHPTEGNSFYGILDEIRLSDDARYVGSFTPDAQLGADADTVGLWTFDDGSGSTVDDESGEGNTATIHSASWSTTSTCSASSR